MKNILLIIIVCIQLFSCDTPSNAPEKYTRVIPLGENSWISNDNQNDNEIIKKEGIRNWEGDRSIHAYFRTSQKGTIKVGLNMESAGDGAQIKVSLGGTSKTVKLKENTENVYVGEFQIEKPGYQQLILEGLDPGEGKIFEINELLLAGPVSHGDVNFVKDNFHFGRRGPSVHLRYPIPEENEKPIYFYNEVEIPKGEDVIGSYFMANGFAHGYFGIQVNSESERRILFSVWSPFDTQDPSKIPENQKVILLKKGEGVHTGEFGNEGSGGQSFKRYMWRTDTTYRFLLKGEPSSPNHTIYSAYFYAPEKGKWELMASFRRPKSGNYLSNLYSFLENFVPATGDVSRKANYKNQWVYDKNDKWVELKTAIFTADATANQKNRLDYAGGEIEGGYFLKNCGFFDSYTPVNSAFQRKASGVAPVINFEELP